MSICSDKWIRRQCTPPTHAILNQDGAVIEYLTPRNADHLETVQFRVDRRPGAALIAIADLTHPDNVLRGWTSMIHPFADRQVRNAEDLPIISYGVSSYGYDVRCANEFEVFTNVNGGTVDPKNFDKKMLHRVVGDECIIPPNSFALARTVEWFKIPRNVLTVCLGKSTYARCGIIVNVTPLEPEWEGHVTLEFSNTTTLPAKIYANEGVAQMLFFESDEECEVSYKDRNGKYQGQSGVTLPRS